MATTSIPEQIKILIQMQAIDGQIYALKLELQEKPSIAERLKQEHAEVVARIEAEADQYKQLEVQKNDLEMELGSKEEHINKLKTKQNEVKTNKEYSAVQIEIEGAKADQSVLEEKIIILMDEVDAAKDKIAENKQQIQAEEKALNEKLATLDGEVKALEAQIATLEGEREGVVPNVDGRVLSQYQRILERKSGSALAPIAGTQCLGCHMAVPPQQVNEVMAGESLNTCGSCNRILYIPEEGE